MQSPVRLVLLLLLVALPLVEIALIIKLGQVLGFWPVVLAILLTGIGGARIIQTQGLATFRRLSEALASNIEPHKALADGALLLLAGVLLILPGPLCDAAGLVLLLAPVRSLATRVIFSRIVIVRGGAGRPEPEQPWHSGGDQDRRQPVDGTIIEGEFERIDERTIDPRASDAKPPPSGNSR